MGGRILKEQNNWDIFLLATYFFSLTLSVVNEKYITLSMASSARIIMLVITLIYFSYKYIKKYQLNIPKPERNIQGNILFIWLLFGFSILISEAINLQLPTAGIGYILFVPISYFLIFNKGMDNTILTSLKSMFFSQFSIIIWSLFEVMEWNTAYYLGITNNSNNMGLIAYGAAFSSILILLYHQHFKSGSKLMNIFYGISGIISLGVLFQTGSRTPLVALIFPVGLFFLYILFINKIKIYRIIASIIAFIVLYNVFLKDMVDEYVLSKFQTTSLRGDLFSGRGAIWENAISDTTIFGHGESYFENILGIASHNVVIQFLGEYGLIAMILFIIFLISILYLSLKNIFTIDDNFSFIIIFMFLSSYLIISMGESIFGVITDVETNVLFILIGYLLFYRRSEYDKYIN